MWCRGGKEETPTEGPWLRNVNPSLQMGSLRFFPSSHKLIFYFLLNLFYVPSSFSPAESPRAKCSAPEFGRARRLPPFPGQAGGPRAPRPALGEVVERRSTSECYAMLPCVTVLAGPVAA